MSPAQVMDWPENYQRMSDEDVVALAKSGNDGAVEHLLSRYRALVESKAKTYYLAGADRDDVVQEGMIGLYKAIRDFRSDRLPCFRAFADLCVTRQIITAVKGATRKKHIPLQQYVLLQKKCSDGEGNGTLLDVLPNTQVVDPEKQVIDRLFMDAVWAVARTDLSELELGVLDAYIEGKTYDEMAEEFSCRTKSIDNALQRAKRKIGEKVLTEAA